MSGGRHLAAGALLVLVGLAAWQLPRLQVDNRLERWFGEDAAAASDYARFRSAFGSDDFVIAALSADDILSPGSLDAQLAAAETVEAVPGVARVEGPPIVYREQFGAEDPEACAEELTTSPFYRDLFVGRDGRTVGLLVAVSATDDPAARRRVVGAIRAALAPLEARGVAVALAGPAVLSAALDQVSLTEARRTLPLAVAGALLVLLVLLRSVRGAVVAALCSAVTVVLTLGTMAAFEVPLDMIGAALPALLGVLGLAGAIHLVRRYQDLRLGCGAAAAVDAAVETVRRPCALAAVTTALGFGSLASSPMTPVRLFGLFAALGLLLSLAATLVLGPLLIRWLRVPPRAARRWIRLDRWLAPLLVRPRRVLLAAAVATLAALACLPLVRVQSDPLDFLPADGPTVAEYRQVGERLTGFHTLEVVVRTPAPWWRPAVAAHLDRLEQRLEASPIVARVLSPLDLERQAARWQAGGAEGSFRLPPDTRVAERLVRGLAGGGTGRALASLATADGRTVRFSVIVRDMDEARFLGLVSAARRAVGGLPEGYGGDVTGMVLQLVSAQQQLLRTQLATFGLALAVVSAAIAVGFGSLRLAALSLVPNTLPIVAAFAAMGLLGLPLDAATVMVASVALGLGVDNAVHLLDALGRRRAAGDGRREAVATTLAEVGPALVVTTATAVLGFGALAGSAFVPIRDFGLLTGLALVTALVAAVLLVPALELAGEDHSA